MWCKSIHCWSRTTSLQSRAGLDCCRFWMQWAHRTGWLPRPSSRFGQGFESAATGRSQASIWCKSVHCWSRTSALGSRAGLGCCRLRGTSPWMASEAIKQTRAGLLGSSQQACTHNSIACESLHCWYAIPAQETQPGVTGCRFWMQGHQRHTVLDGA